MSTEFRIKALRGLIEVLGWDLDSALKTHDVALINQAFDNMTRAGELLRRLEGWVQS